MASKIRLADGRELTVSLSGKRVIEALEETVKKKESFLSLRTPAEARVWISPLHVAAVEDRPDLD